MTYEGLKDAVQGKTWKTVKGAVKKKQRWRQGYKLTPKQVREIRRRVRRGEYQIDVAKAFGVSDVVVLGIARSKIWRSVVGDKPLTVAGHSGARVLTAAIVSHARRAVARGVPIPTLAKRYGVAYATLWWAVTGRTWRHLANAVSDLPPCFSPKTRVLNKTKAKRIRSLKHKGLTNKKLACMFGVSEHAISDVVRGKSWKS